MRLAAEAMATRFELVVLDRDPVHARAAGEEALREIVRLEDVLSFYRPDGALGRVNRQAGRAPVRVPPVLFDLLGRCRELHAATGGRFDPTVGPLMRAWGLSGGAPRVPDPDEIAAVLARCGMEHVGLDAGRRTVRFAMDGMAVDLGGVGKGCAVDEALLLLREAGITNALLHGGTSTIGAIGPGPEGDGWTIGIPWPVPPASGSDVPPRLAARVTLRDEALSVSEISGKGFTAQDRFHGHVIDPTTGRPVEAALLAAVVGPSAAETDALSTALLGLGAAAREAEAFRDPGRRWLVAWADGNGGIRFLSNGLTPEARHA